VTVIGLDDTDSRERGMCTTYVAQQVARAINGAGGDVRRLLLVRLNPAVEFKTRGNAAIAVHADVDAEMAFRLAHGTMVDLAETDDPATDPGLVVADEEPDSVPDRVAAFARDAVDDHHEVADAVDLATECGYRAEGWKAGRGQVGALAAVGAWRAFGGADGDWTFEFVAYREADNRGTDREFDRESVFAAADHAYPKVFDTVDRAAGEAVCFPNTPGPVLFGVRGDDPRAVVEVADRFETEPVESSTLFVTNQGTDAHLVDADLTDVADGRSYRVTGQVVDRPRTREGGHVFCTVGPEVDPPHENGSTPPTDHEASALDVAAFEPTKGFRDAVRSLRPGDRVTVCGEATDGTLKLEKFAVRDLVRSELATPTCPSCGRSMESAGRDQGYRCRDCETSAPGKVSRSIERDLEVGWHEVPPRARRHIAKPLVRGGFDGAIHPAR
jgi:tRNA(Ile2)-agmatinylcytidine synthase